MPTNPYPQLQPVINDLEDQLDTRCHCNVGPWPVKEVVPGHHAEVACGVGARGQFVVQLLKLLLQQISSFALRLAAGGNSAEHKTQQDNQVQRCLSSLYQYAPGDMNYTSASDTGYFYSTVFVLHPSDLADSLVMLL